MQELETKLKNASRALQWKPEIIDASTNEGRTRLDALLSSGTLAAISDDFTEQQREFYALCNPSTVFNPDFEAQVAAHLSELQSQRPLVEQGRWVYFPWRAALVHVLEHEQFQRVRTSRNRNLITEEEQAKFAAAVVGIAGLSVGNSIALAVVLQGGADHIKLADFDRLALSNINRVRTSISEFGNNKAEMTARQIFELNPYATVELFTEGLTPQNVTSFFEGAAPLTVVIDEIDNLAVKCLIREHSRRLRLPVVMAADNGDNGVVDIERYDLDPQLPFFHGRMGEVSYESLKGLDKRSIGRLIARHVGPETTAPRMRASLGQMGKTIVSWPQLGGAALLNGPAVAYCVRAIACDLPLENNRALIDLDEKLKPGHMAPEEVAKRNAEAKEFAKAFGL